MLEEKKLKEAESRIKHYLREGVITTKQKAEQVDFFLTNAENSIDAAKVLFELSTNEEKRKLLGFTYFNGLLWVVNASYYSMFYMTRALLEQKGIKLKTDLSIHAVTFDALIPFFYLTGKLQKEFLDDFLDAKEEMVEILGKQKADELIEDYFYEKQKRGIFTYNMGEILLQSKAETSLKRAQKFRIEIRNILMKER